MEHCVYSKDTQMCTDFKDPRHAVSIWMAKVCAYFLMYNSDDFAFC